MEKQDKNFFRLKSRPDTRQMSLLVDQKAKALATDPQIQGPMGGWIHPHIELLSCN